MKYFIISVAAAGICLCMPPSDKPAGKTMSLPAHDNQSTTCMANISAGALCHASEQKQQEFVLVRGQLLPL